MVVRNCGDEECGICTHMLCDCCVMSDMETDAKCCDIRCGGVLRCGICCGVKYTVMLGVWLCDVEHVVLQDVVVRTGGAEADCSVM